MMYVAGNVLSGAEFIESPNQSGALEDTDIKFIVLHYTGGPSLESAVNWFQRPVAKASAHLIIDDIPFMLPVTNTELTREARIHVKAAVSAKVVQMVPFNRKAWHSGRSKWEIKGGRTYTGLNANSIGIELVNPGVLTKTASKGWMAWYGEVFNDAPIQLTQGMGLATPISQHEVIESDLVTHSGWASFPKHQIDCLMDVLHALLDAYPIEDILAHSDIAPTRKVDPGPAFPMAKIRSMFIEGRRA